MSWQLPFKGDRDFDKLDLPASVTTDPDTGQLRFPDRRAHQELCERSWDNPNTPDFHHDEL